MPLWILLAQAAAATAAPQTAAARAAPSALPVQSFSILVPIPNEPCVPPRIHPKDPGARGDDIVVCGRPLPSQKLPYRDEIVPDHPVPSNPDMSGAGASAATSPVCGARSGGCPAGIDMFGAGTALVRLVQKAVAPNSCCEDAGEGTNPIALAKDMVGGVTHAFRKKPDKSNRVSIPLDDAEPKGQILP
ncbi:MAG: hypothetical protein ABIS14_01280 [Sphingomonas sp.]